MMEDPKERDRKFREHLYATKDRCKKTKEMWSLPLRPYGFWTFERHNAQIFWDAQINCESMQYSIMPSCDDVICQAWPSEAVQAYWIRFVLPLYSRLVPGFNKFLSSSGDVKDDTYMNILW
ncbi:NADH-ubiquinone oxidoreductase 11kDa subunit [Dillenia turbinata]|uniref:NADH-ubiquinone oxidoreductase 11kDa subunit n=1 Tax=Dillenia turbinata TaxID=194707 RepID=A0AAN8Z0Z9_9MAGN